MFYNRSVSIVQERKKDLIILVVLLGILALVAITMGNPGSSANKEENPSRPTVNPIMTAPPPKVNKAAALQKTSLTVGRGDTITQLLQKGGMTHSEAHELVTNLKGTYNLARIHPGQKVILTKKDAQLVGLRYNISKSSYLISEKLKNGTFKSEIVNIPYTIKTAVVSGELDYSLFSAIYSIGEKPELADSLAKLYEYDIDFNRDIRRGDKFRIIIEKQYLNGKFAGYRNILASEFINRDKSYKIIRYTSKNGATSYYHPDGRAVKKLFLRCPLPFMRVTSRYGNRKHPVLGFSARHNGVDFGAPTGTIIRASASGTVIKSGYHRVKGRFIVIRHPNRYETHYYHLSRIKSCARVGKKVAQGDIIGNVGSTGRSTGPHLHYGIRKNRRFINPLTLKSPSVKPIHQSEIDQFSHYSASLFSLLSDRNLSLEFDKLYLPEIPTFMHNSISEPGIKLFMKNSLH